MNLQIFRPIFLQSRRFLATSGLEILAKHNSDNKNKLISPKYYDYFERYLREQDYYKQISNENVHNLKMITKEYSELYEIVSGSGNVDEEFMNLAISEALKFCENLEELENSILNQAISDDREVDDCTFEVRAGVGGKEAAIFTEDLAKMYLKYFKYNSWNVEFNEEQFEQVDMKDSSSLKTFMFEISGQQCYRFLRHEAGIHRVQRVSSIFGYSKRFLTLFLFQISGSKNRKKWSRSYLNLNSLSNSNPEEHGRNQRFGFEV